MVVIKAEPVGYNTTLASSSSNNHPAQADASSGPRRDIQFSDIIDGDIREKFQQLRVVYPFTPAFYLIYTLVRCDRVVEGALAFLESTSRNKNQYSSTVSADKIEDITDPVLQKKVRSVRRIYPCTVWWAFYALKTCDGSLDDALSLLTEGIVNTSTSPPLATLDASPHKDSISVEAPAKSFTPVNDSPLTTASPLASSSRLMPPTTTGNTLSSNGKAHHPSSIKKENWQWPSDYNVRTVPIMAEDKGKGKAREDGDSDSLFVSDRYSASPEIDSTRPADAEAEKIVHMQSVFPHLTVDECKNSLQITRGNLEGALELEMDGPDDQVKEELSQADDFGPGSSSCHSQKRKSGTPDMGPSKKPRTLTDEKSASILPSARLWARSFLELFESQHSLVTIRLANDKTYKVPKQLLCANSNYFRELLDSEVEQSSPQEISLLHVHHALFDLTLQYIVCRNVSFRPGISKSILITTILDFIVLANNIGVLGTTITMFPVLETILKEDRDKPIKDHPLKVSHIIQAFTLLPPNNPIRKLFVKASVRPHLEEKEAENPISCSSDSDDDQDTDDDDDDESKTFDIDIQNKPAHFAANLNKEFEVELLKGANKVIVARESRPKNPYSRSEKNKITYFTDPLDNTQFTL